MGVFGETYCCDCGSWFSNGELSTPFGVYVVFSFVLFPKGTCVVVGDIIVLLI